MASPFPYPYAPLAFHRTETSVLGIPASDQLADEAFQASGKLALVVEVGYWRMAPGLAAVLVVVGLLDLWLVLVSVCLVKPCLTFVPAVVNLSQWNPLVAAVVDFVAAAVVGFVAAAAGFVAAVAAVAGFVVVASLKVVFVGY